MAIKLRADTFCLDIQINGKRIRESTELSYGQLKLAARAGELEGHDPALIEGLKPAWGARTTWMHILPFCTLEPAPDEN